MRATVRLFNLDDPIRYNINGNGYCYGPTMSDRTHIPVDRGANAVPPIPSHEAAVSSLNESMANVLSLAAHQVETPRRSCAHRWVLRIMERDGQGILRMLWRMLGREHDVMDAYQDCFCRLASRGKQGSIRAAKAYVYRTAANVAIEMIRQRNRRQSHWPAIAASQACVERRRSEGVAADAGTADAGTPAVDKEALRVAIAALPPHLASVVVLRDLQQLPYDEVGRTLGITPATARVYRRHAVVKLAELLEEKP